ncbi:MAG: hypothetical protein JNM69_14650 [Archangium sp.]|nr:hypothetical protein [Archangium sp.]
MKRLLVVLLIACGNSPGPLEDGARPVSVLEVPTLPNPFTTPCLQLPSKVTFAAARVGCDQSRQQITVKNVCAFKVGLGALQQPGPFGVVELPLPLEPNAEGRMVVGFAPGAVGALSGTLTVNALADGHSQPAQLAVEGEGTQARVVSFEQLVPIPPRLSLLFIVDDDGVVDAEQNIRRYGNYLATLEWPKVDLVVTNLSGTLQAPDGVQVLSTDSPDFEARFARASRTTPTPGKRSCHDTAAALRSRGQPAGFWAKQHAVICVTNETDASDVPGTSMVAQWASTRFPPPFSVVAPLSTERCGQRELRFDPLVAATRGVREDLCTPNWSTALMDGSRAAFGFQTVFFLQTAPSLRSAQTLRVQLDGVELLPLDRRGAKTFSYDPALHAVRFEPLSAPTPGARLTTRWETCD